MFLPQCFYQIADGPDLVGIKSDGRLIQKKQFRLIDKGVGQTYALMAALETRSYTPTMEDLAAFCDELAAQQVQAIGPTLN